LWRDLTPQTVDLVSRRPDADLSLFNPHFRFFGVKRNLIGCRKASKIAIFLLDMDRSVANGWFGFEAYDALGMHVLFVSANGFVK
jgi:hypothetical protein